MFEFVFTRATAPAIATGYRGGSIGVVMGVTGIAGELGYGVEASVIL